jgi:hypothetical protein
LPEKRSPGFFTVLSGSDDRVWQETAPAVSPANPKEITPVFLRKFLLELTFSVIFNFPISIFN